ncbi:selenoprotein S-like isoform X1 [Sinocyclocheilus anshuiensis]|uniref:selenoprotein S-like isoform X1 n=1 Tax=Sinocyclocheilus anshuiensis TaxID=1608454 RepID=UPI0007B8433F|nr:PREDICTED: selenoprotein S-like isoform X1 [Sinocyclocheilus anshuiensis]
MEAQDDARVRNEDVPPQNQDLSFLLPAVTAFLSEYGWYAAFACVGVYLLLQHLRKNRSTDSQSSPVSTSSQDPDSVVRRQAALEASRRRMQEEQDARAAELRERQQRLEEDKRRQKIEMWDSMKEGKSYKGKAQQSTEEATSSSSLRPKTDKKPLRNSGYSPLSGDGGGTCSWRPGRRGPSAGG